MNYYKRHLGDYARDTGHLTALEHGIYNLLLDWYYINEKPIPHEKAKRIAKANPNETQTVLCEFFSETPEGWKHARADREIADYRCKAQRNRELGKLGGRPKKTQTVSETEPKRNPSHKPLATSQEKKDQKKGAALSLPPWLQESVWADWHAFRNTRKGWTPKARALSLSTLAKLREQGHDPKAIVEQSIERGWTGLFPIRSESHANRNSCGAVSAAERVAAVNAEAERRQSAEVIQGEFRNVG